MKLTVFKSSLVLLSLIYVGCSSQPKQNEASERQPQSSVYEDSEVSSDDLDVTDAYELDENDTSTNQASLFRKICIERPSELAPQTRVVTTIDGKLITGNITASYQSGKLFVVSTDYGPKSSSRHLQRVKKSSDEVSKALDCLGMKSQKVYGLFNDGNHYYTGHVREVFKNGVVRFVNDRFKEQFSTIDQSSLELIRSPLKLKSVFFNHKGQELQGQIRRVFEKNTVLIKSKVGGLLVVRKINEVKIQD